MKIYVFVIDDQKEIIRLVMDGLPPSEFRSEGTPDPERGLERVKRNPPDILLLDWRMPEVSGLAMCQTIRKDPKLANLPILMLTALDNTSNKVEALESGADDYLTKPFHPEELRARIRAILRRKGGGLIIEEVVMEGDLVLNGERHEIKIKDMPVKLTLTEFELLYILVKRKGHALSREFLLDRLWGDVANVGPRTVDVHVTHLRQKLGKMGDCIQNIRGLGYFFERSQK